LRLAPEPSHRVGARFGAAGSVPSNPGAIRGWLGAARRSRSGSGWLIVKAEAHASPELETDFHLIEHFTSQQVPRSHRRNFDRKTTARQVHDASPGSNFHGLPISQAQGNPGRARQNFSSDAGRNEKPAIETRVGVGQISDIPSADGQAEFEPGI